MSSSQEPKGGRPCRWCGKANAGVQRICPECKLPNRRVGWLWTGLRLLIIPIAIAAVAYGFSHRFNELSKQREVELQDRRAIAKAFRQLGAAFNDFRKAGAEMALACKAVDEESCYRNLKKSVIDLDHAFDSIGPRLAIFNEIFQRQRESKKELDNENDTLTKTWLNCFIVPYHGDGKDFGPELSYWRRIQAVFENDDPNENGPRWCKNNRCRPEAEKIIGGIVRELFSGTCVCGRPATNRKLTWFLDEVQRLGFNIPPSGMEAAVERWPGTVNEAILNAPGCPNKS